MIERNARASAISLDDIAIEDPATSPKRERYAQYLWERRQRKGLSLGEAHRRLYNGNYFGSVMVACGDADALLSGMTMHYPETIRPALEVIGAHPQAGLVSGMYMLVFEKHVVFCGDTTVNIDPTAEQLAQIAYAAAASFARSASIRASRCCRSRTSDRCATRTRKRWPARSQLLRQRDPNPDRGRRDAGRHGPRRADSGRELPVQRLEGTRQRADISELERRQHRLQAAATTWAERRRSGPILVGMRHPVHVLEQGADVQDIVNMAAVAVMDAQSRTATVDVASAVGD